MVMVILSFGTEITQHILFGIYYHNIIQTWEKNKCLQFGVLVSEFHT